MRINSVKKIWNRAQHNAFTDLCHFDSKYFCCFREANNHISGDGKVRIVTLDDSGGVAWSDCLRVPGADLRDPKLSVTPDEKLLLIAYARFRNEQNKTVRSQAVVWFSGDGKSWSQPKFIGPQGWWLWRLRWHEGKAYGFAYNRRADALDFYSGNPLRTFELHQPKAFSKEKLGLGYPNESDLFVDKTGIMHALVRRDADSCTAQLGTSNFPYKNWQWHDLKGYVGGPVMFPLDKNFAMIAGRIWEGYKPKTAVLKFDLRKKRFCEKLIVPSAGDSSYPGLVRKGDSILMSYYSAHEQQKCCIYLAEIEL